MAGVMSPESLSQAVLGRLLSGMHSLSPVSVSFSPTAGGVYQGYIRVL